MSKLAWIGLIILCLPGLPLALLTLWLLGMFDKSCSGSSGHLGLAFLVAMGCGAIGWIGVALFGLGAWLF